MPAVSRAPRPGEAELRAAVAGRGAAETRRCVAWFLPQPPAAPGAARVAPALSVVLLPDRGSSEHPVAPERFTGGAEPEGR